MTSTRLDPAADGKPVLLQDGWPIGNPDDMGLDGALLRGIADRMKAMSANVHAVLIARRGRLVFEQYFSGYDEPWGYEDKAYDFDISTRHDMRSVSKSVTSLLAGIAIDRKLISPYDRVIDFFTDYAELRSPGWDKIAVRHLLSMSSGIAWEENLPWTDPKNDEPHLGTEADPIRYVLSKPIIAEPDALWTYNGGNVDLLGAIIERTSGKACDAFARETLFERLGIAAWEWMSYPPNGRISMAAGLRLRPRDAAKIGQLMLYRGAWAGRQVVSGSWVETVIRPRFQAIGYFGGLFYYGYLWWIGRTLFGGRSIPWIAAQGFGGQRIFIIPDLDIVVVTTGGMYADPRQGNPGLEILYRFVIPSVIDGPRP